MCKPRLLLLAGIASLVCSVHGTSGAQTNLDALVARFWDWRLYEYPEYGTKFGIFKHPDRIEEYTEEAFSRQVANATELLRAVSAIDRPQLEPQGKISRDILEGLLDNFIDGYKYRAIGMYNMLNSVNDPLKDWYSLVSWQKVDTVTGLKNLLARYNKLPTQIDQIIVLMRKAIALGTTRNAAALTGVMQTMDVEIATDPQDSKFFAPFLNMESSIPDISARAAMTTEATRVVRDLVKPAWVKLRNFTQDEYLPNTAAGYGVGSLPGGQAFYQAALKWHTSVDMTPQQVHDLGLKEVDRIGKLMKKEMAKDGFNGTIQEYVTDMKTHSANFYHSQDAMFEGFKEILNQTHAQMHRLLRNLPPQKVVLVRSEARNSPLAYYSSPSLDGSRSGKFIANVFDPQTKLKSEMYSITLHEAEPGHHTQAAYAIQSAIPDFRRAIDFRRYFAVPFNWLFHTAYVEGWGLYAEYLGEELGIYNAPHAIFTRYSFEMLRAIRLVVDTGIHTKGWSRQRAVDYIASYTTLSSDTVDWEVNRYISLPGQACAYKIGEIQFKALRRKAEQQLGAMFDLRDFHDELLRLGPSPLYIVERQINDWISASITNTSAAAASTRPATYTLAICAFLCAFIISSSSSLVFTLQP